MDRALIYQAVAALVDAGEEAYGRTIWLWLRVHHDHYVPFTQIYHGLRELEAAGRVTSTMLKGGPGRAYHTKRLYMPVEKRGD